jgi:hypothetical protein
VLEWLVPFGVRDDFLEQAQRRNLLEQILASPYLGASDLNEGFSESQGFTIFFKRDQMARALHLLPTLEGYLEKVLDPRCQAFFINPLVVFEGHGIAPHADKTLLSFLSQAPFPRRVSVLYLQVPQPMQGGELVLHRNAWVRARVQPRENRLVEFAGWLSHEVTPWKASLPRISLVCEQYRVSAQMLAQLPDFHLESTVTFDSILGSIVQEKQVDF